MSQTDFSSVSNNLDTIGDYIRFAASQFNEANLYFGHGTDNAWDEAINLVMFTLSLPLALVDKVFDCKLSENEKQAVLSIIQARIVEAKPAAYLTNQAMFAKLPFYVDERVLVPRSPLGELIEDRFTQLLPADQKFNRILDLCTGSGCIAIASGHYFPEAEVDAVDLSIDALNVAQMNIENHGMTEQVTPIQSDVFSGVQGLTYDLILTNPPYVDAEDVASLPEEFLHEPEMGLGCGHDGLDIVRKILAQSAQHLNENGVLICEVGNSQIHVEAEYPEVPFTWLSFLRGGHGVFMLTKKQLEKYAETFNERLLNEPY